jgi:hypothetical protein
MTEGNDLEILLEDLAKGLRAKTAFSVATQNA